ncbi:MAG: hypothetical protein ABI634_01685 [Acidobacteriota bacterium]
MDLGLTHLASSWASVYSNSAATRTAIGFAHVGGLVVSGGTALSADRAVLRASKAGQAIRERQAAEFAITHRVVVATLAIVVASGALLMLSDLDTYLVSKTFWIKMAAIAVLSVNGVVMVAIGRRIERGHDGWMALRAAAITSMTFWLLTTLLGSALPNVG